MCGKRLNYGGNDLDMCEKLKYVGNDSDMLKIA